MTSVEMEYLGLKVGDRLDMDRLRALISISMIGEKGVDGVWDGDIVEYRPEHVEAGDWGEIVRMAGGSDGLFEADGAYTGGSGFCVAIRGDMRKLFL